MRLRCAGFGLCLAWLSLAACTGGTPAQPGTAAAAEQPDTRTAERQIADSFGNDFADADAPAQPSYEVAIASAAADQTRGLEACDQKPVAERRKCKDQVNAAWEIASARAADSRGNRQ